MFCRFFVGKVRRVACLYFSPDTLFGALSTSVKQCINFDN